MVASDDVMTLAINHALLRHSKSLIGKWAVKMNVNVCQIFTGATTARVAYFYKWRSFGVHVDENW